MVDSDDNSGQLGLLHTKGTQDYRTNIPGLIDRTLYLSARLLVLFSSFG